jgi:hypothetical protein
MNTLFVVVVIYGLCFIFLYITPAVLFLRGLKITNELKEPQNLTIEPQYDKNKNIVFITNNFDNFSLDLKTVVRGNYPLKILGRICADAKSGKKYNPAFYLSLYKRHYIRFLGNLFLASHIAPVITIIAAKFAIGNLFDILLSLQFIWYILLIVLQRLLAYNFDIFMEVFYQNWHDKILNFDAISIDALKDKLFAESHSVSGVEIHKIVSELEEALSAPVRTLSSSSSILASALKELAEEKQKGEIVTAESIIAALDANFERVRLLCESLECTAALSGESYKELHNFVRTNKVTINAIDKLADEFSSLRKTLAGNMNTYETAAIEKLNEITTALENNVNRTFTTIEETLTTNAQELSKTYDRFFDICKTLSERRTEEDA